MGMGSGLPCTLSCCRRMEISMSYLTTIKDYLLSVLMLTPDTPLILVPVLGLIILFIYFSIVITIRDTLLRIFGKDHIITKAVVYLIGGRFLYQDVVANYICFAPLILSWPNSYGEGRTITAHINAIITANLASIKVGELHGFNRWRVGFCLFLAKSLNKVDKLHIKILSELDGFL